MLSALVLFVLAIGSVKGFAFTLGLTTLIDVMVVCLFTKPLMTLLARTKFFGGGHKLSGSILNTSAFRHCQARGHVGRCRQRPAAVEQRGDCVMSKLGAIGHRLYTGEVSYDFIGHRRRWYTRLGHLDRRLDHLVGVARPGLSASSSRAALTSRRRPRSLPRLSTRCGRAPQLRRSQILTSRPSAPIGNNQVRVQTRTLDPTEEVPEGPRRDRQRGRHPTRPGRVQPDRRLLGGQITERALIALAVFLVLVALVIGIYFRDAKMSAAALIALVHDLILTIGIYALVGFTVTPATLIGVLTILGYSLYDTVVVFDKVRENVRDIRRQYDEDLLRGRQPRCQSGAGPLRSTPR